MSLGAWSKDYIMYPLLKSSLFQKIGAICKKKFGKNFGKKVPVILSIFILWLLIGIWHGASYKYIFAAGILPWFYLTISEIFEKVPDKLIKLFHINTSNFSFRLFQSIRTFLLMCFVWLFVCSPYLSDSIDVIKSLLTLKDINLLPTLKVLKQPIFTLMIVLVIIAEYLNYKKINIFEKFREQNIIFRWIILFSIIIIILIYGQYGPQYNAASFIYGGF